MRRTAYRYVDESNAWNEPAAQAGEQGQQPTSRTAVWVGAGVGVVGLAVAVGTFWYGPPGGYTQSHVCSWSWFSTKPYLDGLCDWPYQLVPFDEGTSALQKYIEAKGNHPHLALAMLTPELRLLRTPAKRHAPVARQGKGGITNYTYKSATAAGFNKITLHYVGYARPRGPFGDVKQYDQNFLVQRTSTHTVKITAIGGYFNVSEARKQPHPQVTVSKDTAPVFLTPRRSFNFITSVRIGTRHRALCQIQVDNQWWSRIYAGYVPNDYLSSGPGPIAHVSLC